MGTLNSKEPAFWSSTDSPPEDRSQWMRLLNDDTLLCDLSIPGTHDSASFHTESVGNGWVWCQSLDIRDQWKMGIRYFDIRARIDGLFLHHGSYFLGQTLEDFFGVIRQLLKDNPKETAFVRLKQEIVAEDKKDGPKFRQEVTKLLFKMQLPFRKNTESRTVGDTRGLLIFVDGHFAPTNKVIEEDTWVLPTHTLKDATVEGGSKTKVNLLKDLMEVHRNSLFDIMYVGYASWSTTDNGIPYMPITTAAATNPRLHVLVPWVGAKKKLGVLVMDYPGPKLVKDIIFNNYFPI